MFGNSSNQDKTNERIVWSIYKVFS